ncbi:MAG TPA: hypothetical protein VGN04_07170 [Herbaspirillum sp.]
MQKLDRVERLVCVDNRIAMPDGPACRIDRFFPLRFRRIGRFFAVDFHLFIVLREHIARGTV